MAVMTPTLLSTYAFIRSAFAVIPSTQKVRNTRNAFVMTLIDWSRLNASTGSMTFSSNWPASEARQTVVSFPITWNATWFTTSAITGFTLPGMIDEPGWRAGSFSSPRPQRGPDAMRRRSFAIFERFIMQTLRAAETSVYASVFWVPSTRSGELTIGQPESSARYFTTALM